LKSGKKKEMLLCVAKEGITGYVAHGCHSLEEEVVLTGVKP